MTEVAAFLAAHPPVTWAAFAGLFLSVELLTGSGWLLWPCAAAGAVGLVAMTALGTWPVQLLLFAGLTAVFTIMGRRWLAHRRTLHSGADLNAPDAVLVGRVGEVSAPFQNGRGRVFVHGKDWAADLDPAADASVGTPVKVRALLSSSRLKVSLF